MARITKLMEKTEISRVRSIFVCEMWSYRDLRTVDALQGVAPTNTDTILFNVFRTIRSLCFVLKTIFIPPLSGNNIFRLSWHAVFWLLSFPFCLILPYFAFILIFYFPLSTFPFSFLPFSFPFLPFFTHSSFFSSPFHIFSPYDIGWYFPPPGGGGSIL